MNVLEWLLSQGGRIDSGGMTSIDQWEDVFFKSVSDWSEPVDKAVIGGFLSDRAGYAFAAGYESALMRLVPSLPERTIVSFSVTEERGGHPAAIESTLKKAPDGKSWILDGRKKFATLAGKAQVFLVAASTGTSPDKKNRIRMARIDRDAPGTEIILMSNLPFIPEISHGELTFKGVHVKDSEIFPNDGYADYIKPFRTIEDVHVSAAIAGYIFRVASQYRWPQSFREQALVLLAGLRTLALEDPKSPAVHIALGGLRTQMSSLFENAAAFWKNTDTETRTRWERDKAVLSVGGKARVRRLEKAWSHY
jgi:acyl-CoA dehydrogenase